MQALLEHISALLQTKNAVQLAEPLPLIQQEQPILEEKHLGLELLLQQLREVEQQQRQLKRARRV